MELSCGQLTVCHGKSPFLIVKITISHSENHHFERKTYHLYRLVVVEVITFRTTRSMHGMIFQVTWWDVELFRWMERYLDGKTSVTSIMAVFVVFWIYPLVNFRGFSSHESSIFCGWVNLGYYVHLKCRVCGTPAFCL